ncbi:MAG: PA0069 family radical SAM protein [Gammaproteobacteria bacterium]|nr:PA0069 family radical SAM protein [Gammaproteobacteria bacterium]
MAGEDAPLGRDSSDEPVVATPVRAPRKGRGAGGNPDVRHLGTAREAVDDGWGSADETPPPLKTSVTLERAKSIITRNDSPDIPFEQSINPFRGCEHGCVYCYARPAHAYVDLSPGLDFESRLFAKPEAAALLRAELAKPAYRCSPIALGGNTDAYQPIERKLRITRGIVEVLAETKHPFTIVTKSALVERDLDLLAPMAELDLVRVFVSVTSLDRGLARRMEPRAAAPQRRLETIARLAAAGVPVGVMFAPIVPALNDHELESVLEAAAAAGARGAGYVVLRLPREVNGLFKDWLVQHYPLRAGRVMSRVRELRGGQENVSTFGERLQGAGIFAKLTAERFRKACERHGLDEGRGAPTTRHFTPPRPEGPQLELF